MQNPQNKKDQQTNAHACALKKVGFGKKILVLKHLKCILAATLMLNTIEVLTLSILTMGKNKN